MAWPTEYSVVIITSNDGIISRSAGTNLANAKIQAVERREDFPTAKEIRVVSAEHGVLFSC